jgi:hypothetical protein
MSVAISTKLNPVAPPKASECLGGVLSDALKSGEKMAH